MLMQTGLAQCLFSAPVVKLLRRKTGACGARVAQVGQDRYIKALARKGVVAFHRGLYEQRGDAPPFCPGMADTRNYGLGEKNHSPSNTGDGHRMGMWIGAKLQDSPHAPCAHHMGSVFGASGLCC